jgi:hypothetical protein
VQPASVAEQRDADALLLEERQMRIDRREPRAGAAESPVRTRRQRLPAAARAAAGAPRARPIVRPASTVARVRRAISSRMGSTASGRGPRLPWRAFSLFALANLYLVRRQLLPPAIRCVP